MEQQRRAQLVGHTAIALLSLAGYFLYTATYSIVYQLNAANSKPAAVVEMWMALTHLSASLLTCAVHALVPLPALAEAQSALFLGIAFTVTVCSLACMQDAGQCSAYFPAAAFPPLAAAGAMAWAWVVYAASLGCQPAYVSLGLSKGIVAPAVVALALPQILGTLQQTCGAHALCRGTLASCNLPLSITLALGALGLWYGGAFVPPLQIPMQTLALVLLILDSILLLPSSCAALVSLAGALALLLQIIARFPRAVRPRPP